MAVLVKCVSCGDKREVPSETLITNVRKIAEMTGWTRIYMWLSNGKMKVPGWLCPNCQKGIEVD